ncbi:hypothetical protein NPIL_159411 [Nephila pilipes]|uniref:Uncharacterized protein n=1 Tax=Nephila pilipes TaxID=299642 RepID=A0A8X6MZQ8_NEPPI|nr:hypothetical protein NPIL_159411 [Nephila pilipes]
MVNVPTDGNFGIQNKTQILRVPVHLKSQTIHDKFWLVTIKFSICSIEICRGFHRIKIQCVAFSKSLHIDKSLTLFSRLDMSAPDFQMTVSSANKPNSHLLEKISPIRHKDRVKRVVLKTEP